MLVVTTSVGMVDGVHGDTTSPRPAVTLGLVLVHGAGRLKEGLVGTGTTGDNSDHTTGSGGNDLLGARRELDAGLASLRVVTNDGNVVSGGTAESTTVTDLLLNVGNNGTLGHRREREDVADGEGSLLSSVDKLAGVHALVGNEGLLAEPVAVRVPENDVGERSAAARVVDDLLHDTTDVSMALSVIEGAELGGVLNVRSYR